MTYFYLFMGIVSEVVGTSALQASHQFTKLVPSVICFLAYASAFFFLSLTLKVLPVGVSYAIWSGMGIMLITLIGYFFFGQKLDLPAIIGIVLIVAGVVIMNVFSKTVSH